MTHTIQAYTYHAAMFCAPCGATLPEIDPEGNDKHPVFSWELSEYVLGDDHGVIIPQCDKCGQFVRARFLIEARTWRDKTHGNTYYSLRITGEGLDLIVPMSYGHGTLTFRHRAATELGLNWGALSHDQRREMFPVTEYAVPRKRDLHQLEKEAGR